MPKQPHQPVTASELALLQILWGASRPLNKQEILAKANADEPMFAKNSFHLLANELIAKGYLTPIDNGGMGRKNARRYAPTVSCSEFLAIQVFSSETYKPSDIPDILTALLNLSSGIDLDPVLQGIEQVVVKLRQDNEGKSTA